MKITRRTAVVLLAATPAAAGATSKTVAELANTFHAFWKDWADEINSTPPTGISYRGIAIAAQMDEAYKAFRSKRREWEEALRKG